jgi:hypothetical protein
MGTHNGIVILQAAAAAVNIEDDDTQTAAAVGPATTDSMNSNGCSSLPQGRAVAIFLAQQYQC